MATFLSNHDIFAGRRLWDQLGGNVAEYKLAAASYLLQPGTPFIYYGEEIGQAGAAGLHGDLPIRSPMSWAPDPDNGGFTSGHPFRPLAPNLAAQNVAAERADPGSIFSFYKAMIGLRNRWSSIARGSFEASFAQDRVAGWQRRLGEETTLAVINYGLAPATALAAGLPAGASLEAVYPPGAGAVVVDAGGSARIAIPARTVMVFLVRR